VKTLRELLDQRFGTLKTERSEREDEWRQIQRFVAPRRGRLNPTDKTSGRTKHQSITNNVASQAARTLANGLAANVISPAYPWFRFNPDDPDLAEFGAVRKWLDQLERLVAKILFESGFYPSATVGLHELVNFGTAALGQERDFETVARWHPWTTGEYYVATDHRNKPSTVYREIRMTVEAMVGFFGNQVSRTVREHYDRGNLDTKWTVRHAIEPMSQRFASVPYIGRWKYGSLYWDPADADVSRNKFLKISGSNLCQTHVARWEHVPPDPYGNSPVMEALGDVKSLQLLEKRLSQGVGNKMAPPLQGPAMGFAGGAAQPLDAAPGSYTTVNGAVRIEPLIDPRAIMLTDAQWFHQLLEQRLRETCFADLFQTLKLLDRKNITATEVMERKQEDLLLLGPPLTNINSEYLNPIIDSLVEEVFRASEPMWARGQNGMVPPPPQELQGKELQIKYTSLLQQAQEAVRAGPIHRLMAFVGSYAGIFPDLPDKIDADQAVDELAQAWGVAPTVVKDDAIVMQSRQARAEQMAEQQQQAQLATQADVANKLGNASVAPDTALGKLEAA
jgi:hypothetical protein